MLSVFARPFWALRFQPRIRSAKNMDFVCITYTYLGLLYKERSGGEMGHKICRSWCQRAASRLRRAKATDAVRAYCALAL